MVDVGRLRIAPKESIQLARKIQLKTAMAFFTDGSKIVIFRDQTEAEIGSVAEPSLCTYASPFPNSVNLATESFIYCRTCKSIQLVCPRAEGPKSKNGCCSWRPGSDPTTTPMTTTSKPEPVLAKIDEKAQLYEFISLTIDMKMKEAAETAAVASSAKLHHHHNDDHDNSSRRADDVRTNKVVQNLSVVDFMRLKRQEKKDIQWDDADEDECLHINSISSKNDWLIMCVDCGRIDEYRKVRDMRPMEKKLFDSAAKAKCILDDYENIVEIKDVINEGCIPRRSAYIRELESQGINTDIIDVMVDRNMSENLKKIADAKIDSPAREPSLKPDGVCYRDCGLCGKTFYGNRREACYDCISGRKFGDYACNECDVKFSGWPGLCVNCIKKSQRRTSSTSSTSSSSSSAPLSSSSSSSPASTATASVTYNPVSSSPTRTTRTTKTREMTRKRKASGNNNNNTTIAEATTPNKRQVHNNDSS